MLSERSIEPGAREGAPADADDPRVAVRLVGNLVTRSVDQRNTAGAGTVPDAGREGGR